MVHFLGTAFDEYTHQVKQYNLHPDLEHIYEQFPENLFFLPNLIFYGPPGTGKYSQFLYAIQRYSSSNLKYKKNIEIQFNKQQYLYAISDIHFEVDMQFLGCNAKLLWHETYSQIVEIVTAKKNKIGIILCKNFHLVHRELMDVFYSYMQEHNKMLLDNHNGIRLKFVFLAEHISFLPSNIVDSCATIACARPSMTRYTEMITFHKESLHPVKSDIEKPFYEELQSIEFSGRKTGPIAEESFNINNIKQFIMCPTDSHYTTKSFRVTITNIVSQICDEPLSVEMLIQLRECIYNIFTFNLDVRECFWEILNRIICREDSIKDSAYVKFAESLLELFPFFQYFNNNYRPIYHVEHFCIHLICALRDVEHRAKLVGLDLQSTKEKINKTSIF